MSISSRFVSRQIVPNSTDSSRGSDSSPGYPYHLRDLTETALSNYAFKEGPEILAKAANYALLSGGKRFRPVLHLATAGILGGDLSNFLPTACAIEMVHTYSLIHDDLPALDNDDFRRDQPSCHRAFGEDIAIMAGDALFSEAFFLVSSYQTGDAAKIKKVIRLLAEVSGSRGMVGGQVEDLQAGDGATEQLVSQIHLRKTASLISFCCQSAAILADANEQVERELTEFGLIIGEVFQLIDDVIDHRQGKEEAVNMAKIYGEAEALETAEAKTNHALGLLQNLNMEAEILAQIAFFCLNRDS